MKLLVLSDLHVESCAFTPNAESVAAADAVVLAGDIHNGAQSILWARQSFPDKPIVLIAGNHELFGGHWERTLDDIREAAINHEVHFLENDAIAIDRIEFLGTTLWTDFALFGSDQIKLAADEARHFMPDYQRIEGCTPEATLNRHSASRAWLEQQLAKPGDACSRVVVTHHFPHAKSVAAQYQGALSSAAFGSQLPLPLFEQAGLWVHGHTHSSHAYQVAKCLVVCNPRGYRTGQVARPYENAAFNPDLLLKQNTNGRWQDASKEVFGR